jgi:tRNA(adenine34) deaminase
MMPCFRLGWGAIVMALLLSLSNGFIFRNRWTTAASIGSDPLNGSNNQTEIHVHFMSMALEQARKAGERGEVPIGAVIVQRNENGGFVLLSEAHNLVERNFDASSHAELLAMRQAARKIHNWRLLNTTLYTTLEPCPMCLSAAQAFRVSTIVYGAPDHRLGAIETHMRLLDIRHPMHNIDDVVPGVLGNQSAAMMRSFFRKRRNSDRLAPKQQPSFLARRIQGLFARKD